MECTHYTDLNKGSLLGFATIHVPSWNLVFSGLAVFQKDGRRWINFPSKEYQNKDGETKYMPYVRFTDRDVNDRFVKSALTAIDKFCAAQQVQEEPKNLEELDDVPF